MKVYVVTSLIENREIGVEVNVISIEKNKRDAYLKITELLKDVKTEYEENDIDYNIICNNQDTTIIESDNDETITLEYHEMEVA